MVPYTETMHRLDRLDWVQTFVVVAEYGGVKAAASHLLLSPSQVSTHISNLEKSLGHTLMDRSKRPAELTPTGLMFLEHAKQLLAKAHETALALDTHTGTLRGKVVVGTHPSISATFIPEVLANFHEKYPKVTVDITEQMTSRIFRYLIDGSMDLAIRASTYDDQAADLTQIPLWQEPYVAIFPRGHELDQETEYLSPKAVFSYPLIAIGRPGARIEQEIQVLVDKWNTPVPDISWRSEQPQTVCSLVAAGLGVGILNYLAFWTCRPSTLTYRRISQDLTARTVSLWWNEKRKLTGAAESLQQELLRTAPPSGCTDLRSSSLRRAEINNSI